MASYSTSPQRDPLGLPITGHWSRWEDHFGLSVSSTDPKEAKTHFVTGGDSESEKGDTDLFGRS